MDNYRQKTDEFFYDNFSRAWECAVLEEMTPIYICEMDSLIYYLERKETYVQEFAKDYRLAQKLVIEVDGKLKHFKKPKSPYSIVPSKNIVLFKKYEEIVYQCSYRKYFQILNFYINQLKERFYIETRNKKWELQLEELKKGRFKEQVENIIDKFKFWNNSFGNPNSSYEGAKSITLNPKDIVSFKQLNCKDTLRSLIVNGLVKAKDLEVLSEYTQLKTLYLRQMNIKDISFISNLVNLDELGLSGNKIKDLSPLSNLKKLTHLYIVDNPVTDFSVVENMPNLRTLYTDIDQLPDQISWDKIPNRIALRVLKITSLKNYLYNTETIYSRQVSNLVEKSGGKQNIVKNTYDPRRLDIKDRWLYSGLINTLGYQPAVKYDLIKIKSLDCSNSIKLCDDFLFLTEMGDYSCLSAAIKLRDLNLSNRVINDFCWLRKCVNIKKLDLSYTDFDDLSLLSQMKQLTELNLSGCRKLTKESFNALKYMKNLKVLNLSNTEFCNMEFLKDLNKLKSLYL